MAGSLHHATVLSARALGWLKRHRDRERERYRAREVCVYIYNISHISIQICKELHGREKVGSLMEDQGFVKFRVFWAASVRLVELS